MGTEPFGIYHTIPCGTSIAVKFRSSQLSQMDDEQQCSLQLS